jgi:hypothetical protein
LARGAQFTCFTGYWYKSKRTAQLASFTCFTGIATGIALLYWYRYWYRQLASFTCFTGYWYRQLLCELRSPLALLAVYLLYWLLV